MPLLKGVPLWLVFSISIVQSLSLYAGLPHIGWAMNDERIKLSSSNAPGILSDDIRGGGIVSCPGMRDYFAESLHAKA